MTTIRRQPSHYRSKEQWHKLIEQHLNSGITLRAFCKQHNLTEKYFSKKRSLLGYLPFKQKLDAVDVKPTTKQAFIPVQLNSDQAPEVQERLTLKLNTIELSLPVTTSPQWLSALLRALA